MPHPLTPALHPAPAPTCSPAIKQLLSKISKKKDQLAKKKLQVRVMAAGLCGHVRRWWLNPANGDEVVVWWLWLSVAMVFWLGLWCWQGRGRLPPHSYACLLPRTFPHLCLPTYPPLLYAGASQRGSEGRRLRHILGQSLPLTPSHFPLSHTLPFCRRRKPRKTSRPSLWAPPRSTTWTRASPLHGASATRCRWRRCSTRACCQNSTGPWTWSPILSSRPALLGQARALHLQSFRALDRTASWH